MGDTSVKKLQAHAAERGLSLCALLFGRPPAGAGAATSLPPLPDRRELGLTPQAAAALQAFRELVLALHEAVGSRPLAAAIRDIIAQVGPRGAAVARLRNGRRLGLTMLVIGRALGITTGGPCRCIQLASRVPSRAWTWTPTSLCVSAPSSRHFALLPFCPPCPPCLCRPATSST